MAPWLQNINKMKKLSLLIVLIFFIAGIVLFLSNNTVSAVGEVSYCCEKTKVQSDGSGGAWCQSINDPSECDPNYQTPIPSSCESTSYCKLGTCIDNREGTCPPNTPQRVCEEKGGFWDERDPENIPQCQLGCCFIGDGAMFVPQTRCETLSASYGLEINYRKDIQSEVECLRNANPRVKGACVLDTELKKDCTMLTKKACLDLKSSSPETVEFHEGFLCSAEELGTVCGRSRRTTCVEGKEEVYFVDLCGNLANIYDASKIDDQNYWTYITEKSESCNPGGSNAGSESCGNCDWFQGSTCKDFKRGDSVKPTYGDNICKDLSCDYKGQTFQHGDTWCADSRGIDKNLPGSLDYRLTCFDGEVTTEVCDALGRSKICDEGELGAVCRVNRWGDCQFQDNREDCEDGVTRDCTWLEGETTNLFRDDAGNKFVLNESNRELVEQEKKDDGGLKDKKGEDVVGAACVPKYSPGFDFWEPESTAQTQCKLADDWCVAVYTKRKLDPFDNWDCSENCWCIDEEEEMGNVNEDWLEKRNQLCFSLGDCGSKDNYIGEEGYYTVEDFFNVEVVKSQEEVEEVLGG